MLIREGLAYYLRSKEGDLAHAAEVLQKAEGIQAGKYRSARRMLSRGNFRAPALLLLGMVLSESGDADGARKSLGQVLKLYGSGEVEHDDAEPTAEQRLRKHVLDQYHHNQRLALIGLPTLD